ncbi:hypothetical protein IB286_01930 [Spongiibacter sp. KMU-158]|uniref:Lipoprotein n=1 Tax=Spongiibacter pelagi TaxID=2760804 RepID=A0A927GV67_9GAMM|nr:hypothetical protein [Spongiibacter pelagi]MBD2857748.1 hypothetical protein [Spongiibacter pelagi]
MKAKFSLAVAAAALLVSGCASQYSRMDTLSAPAVGAGEADFRILARTEGSAECQKILFFEVGESPCGGGIMSMLTGGANQVTPVEQKAMTRAIDSIPTADAMLAPRYSIEQTSFPLLFTKKRVTVSGKAVEYTKAR